MLKLNKGQETAYNGFKNWLTLSAATAPVARVSGAAGTGKTTIVMEMVRWALIQGWHVQGAAVACKAAEVLHKKGGLSTSSIAALLNGGSKLTSDPKTLLIIDEASMLGDYEFAQVLQQAAQCAAKILLIGDNCQLPPVKGSEVTFAPALTPYSWQLTQVMRQTDDSGVLALATAIRGEKKIFVPKDGMKDVRTMDAANMISEYVQRIKNGESALMIDWTDKARKQHNAVIRNKLGVQREVQVGETLVSIRNTKCGPGACVQNSTLFTVSPRAELLGQLDCNLTYSLNGKPQPRAIVHLHFLKDMVYCESAGYEKITPIIVADNLPTGLSSWYGAEFDISSWPIEILEEFCGLNQATMTYSMRKDVIVATFGYVLTCHKAQGSQADTVYIMQISNDWRWLYTAVTRAAKEVVICESAIKGLTIKTAKEINSIAAKYAQGEVAEQYTGKYIDLAKPIELGNYQIPVTNDEGKILNPGKPIHKVITGILQYFKKNSLKTLKTKTAQALRIAGMQTNEEIVDKMALIPSTAESFIDFAKKQGGMVCSLWDPETDVHEGFQKLDNLCSMAYDEYPANMNTAVTVYVQQEDGYVGYGFNCERYWFLKVENGITLEDAYEKVATEIGNLPVELQLTIRGNERLNKYTSYRPTANWVLSKDPFETSLLGHKIDSARIWDSQQDGSYYDAGSDESAHTTTDKIVVVTDGSCIGNPGPAGWAYVTYSGIQTSGYLGDNSTNNAAELMAVIEAIKDFPDSELEIRTDSEYVLNTISGAWKRGKNLELWAKFDKVSEDRKITYVKVRGSHGKNNTDPFEQLHDTVDELAKAAAKAGRLPEPEAKQVPLTDPRDAKIAELERQLAERDATIKQLKAERDAAVVRANKAETDLAALRKLVRGIAAKYDNNF